MRRLALLSLVLVACGGGIDPSEPSFRDASPAPVVSAHRRTAKPIGDPCDPRGGDPRCPADALTDAGVFQVVCYGEPDPKMYARCTMVCDWQPETELACQELGGECVPPADGGRRICVARD